MKISLTLGSQTRKNTCHGQTTELCRIWQPNRHLNQQLRDRAINCNVTATVCAPGAITNRINAS